MRWMDSINRATSAQDRKPAVRADQERPRPRNRSGKLQALAILVSISSLWGPAAFGDNGEAPFQHSRDNLLEECPSPDRLLLNGDRPGLVCCPDQPYVLCAQSSCTLLAGVAVCECIYVGRGVSLATPYSSFNNPDRLAGEENSAPWTGNIVKNVCDYMETLTSFDKALSTFNTLNYNYEVSGSYMCPKAKNMIWAQCDGAVCEVLDKNGKPKPFNHWKPRDKSTCTCQAVQSPGLMVGPVLEGNQPDPEFAQKFCGGKPPLAGIDYPEAGVHIGLAAKPELLVTPLYQYLFGLYAGLIFESTPRESQSLEPIDLLIGNPSFRSESP